MEIQSMEVAWPQFIRVLSWCLVTLLWSHNVLLINVLHCFNQ